MDKINQFELEKLSSRGLQTACLIFVALTEGITLVLGPSFFPHFNQAMANWLNLCAVFFFALAIRQSVSKAEKHLLFAGLGFCGWMIILQLLNFIHFRDVVFWGPRFSYCSFLCEYLMILPFASVQNDGSRNTGIKITGGFFLAGAFILTCLAAVQVFGTVPDFLKDNLLWDGSRLGTIWNPNILAAIFMISISFLLFFLCSCRKIWFKVLLLVPISVEFYFLILTGSRGAICASLLLIAALILFFIGDRIRLCSRWKKWAMVILIVIILAAIIISVFSVIYLHQQHLKKASDEFAQAVQDENERRFSLQNIFSFSGRSDTWIMTVKLIAHTPEIWFTGVYNIQTFLAENGSWLSHAHNAWLQTFLGLGLVGFLFAVYFTWLALKNSFILLFRRKSSLAQKTICLLSICILITQLLESYLFYEEYPNNFISIVFLMCVGYEYYWVHQPEVSKSSDTGNS